jgi:chromosome segregation ATPase
VRGEVGTLRAEFGDLRGEVGTLRAEFGDLRGEVGTLRAEFGDLRREVGAEIRDVRAEIRDLRGQVGTLEDSTSASFATVQRQLATLAVCMLELRNLVVGGDSADRGRASTTCDNALQALLAAAASAEP